MSPMPSNSQSDIWGVETRFQELLSDIDVVSLDFFDTFVTRALSQPTHVFADMEHRLVQEHGFKWKGFAVDRVIAERQARQKKLLDDKNADVTLDEIYLELSFARRWSFTDRQLFADFERNIEIELVRPVELTNRLISLAREQHKRIVIVSDFYMDSAQITKMAHAVGHEWVAPEQVFVSSEHNGTKHNGVLWDAVLDSLSVSPSRILHVGDNEEADVTQPQSRKIKTLHYPAMHRSHRLPINTAPGVLAHSRLEATYRDRVAYSEWNGAAGVGATTAALIVADQVMRAHHLQTQHPGSSVHFVARDGWLAHKLWNDLGYEDGHYLYASRLVVWRSMLTECTQVEAKEFVGKEEIIEVSRLERRLGCTLQDEHGSSLNPDLLLDATYARKLIVHNADRVVAAGKVLRSHLVEHLRSQGLLKAGVHFIVDLGWRGKTIADIADVVREESGGTSRIEGIFTGLYWDASSQLSRMPMHAAAVTTLDGLDTQLRLLGMMRIMEACIGATHGSVVDFSEIDGSVVPVFADSPVERDSYEKYLSQVADEALQGAKRILLGTHDSGVNAEHVTGAALWGSMISVGHDPHMEELRDLGAVQHVTTLDHLGDGTPLVCTELPDSNVVTTYKTLMRHHWLQGSVCAWETSRQSVLRSTAQEIRERWPVMRRVWTEGLHT